MAKWMLGATPVNRLTMHGVFLVLLAAVFTIGLTFATLELPYLIDDALQNAITTPNLDSHADDISVLKTEMFIAHFKLRLIGYVCFALMVLAIIVLPRRPRTPEHRLAAGPRYLVRAAASGTDHPGTLRSAHLGVPAGGYERLLADRVLLHR
jgi:hypothetical protein